MFSFYVFILKASTFLLQITQGFSLVRRGSSGFLPCFYTAALYQVVAVAEPSLSHSWALPEAQGKERGVACPDLLNVPYSSSLTYPFCSLHGPVLQGFAVLSSQHDLGLCPLLVPLLTPVPAPVPWFALPCRARAAPDNSMWTCVVPGWTCVVPVPCEVTFSAAICAGLIRFRAALLQMAQPPMARRNKVKSLTKDLTRA